MPLPLPFLYLVPKVPKSPECYAYNHPNRIKDFPEETEIVIDPRKLNQSQDDGWRHELDHDVESVFWLLLYWAMVTQPKGGEDEKGYIPSGDWSNLLGDFERRNRLLLGLSSGNLPKNLTHPDYEPLWPLINSLAAILAVDRHWLPESDVRKRPGYMCEAFQRLILQFIVSNRNEEFMTCPLGEALRTVQEVPQSQALTTTPSELRDESERENETKRRRLDRKVCMCHL